MAISEVHEAKMISERAARNKQDRKHSHLINVKDGRLIPNVPALAGRPARQLADGRVDPAKAGHPDYRVYTGDVKASYEERMRYIQSLSHAAPRRAVSVANVEPFDIGTATHAELVDFAKTEYKEDISSITGLRAARAKVAELAKKAGAVVDEPLG